VRRVPLSIFVFYSLIGLALIGLPGSFALDYVQIVRLLVIASGLAWLLLARKAWLRSLVVRGPYGAAVIVPAYCFLLAQFIHTTDHLVLLVAGILFIGGGALGTAISTRRLFSRIDRAVFAAGGLYLFVNLGLAPVFAEPSGLLFSWKSMVLFGEFMALYWTLSWLLAADSTGVVSIGLLWVLLLFFALVSTVGVVRIGLAAFRSYAAVRSFESGEFESARKYMIGLSSRDMGLRWDAVSRETVLEIVEGKAVDAGGEYLVAVGDIAMDYGAWQVAEKAYRQIYDGEHDDAIHARLGDALFEQGRISDALVYYEWGSERDGVEPRDYLSLGVALARMGEWSRANVHLVQGLEFGEANEVVLDRFAAPGDVVLLPIADILPEQYRDYLDRLTLFEVVKLCRNRGWAVLHPAMEIGSTGIMAPVDIEVQSGGGQWNGEQEQIDVKGENHSPHKQGINVVVIHPETGAVVASGNFNTGLYWPEGERLAQFINEVGRDKIIAVSVIHDGATELRKAGQNALWGVGGGSQPIAWGSFALIGVQGAAHRSGLTMVSNQGKVQVGVLAANITDAVADDRQRLESRLQQVAADSTSGIAVYIPGIGPDDRIMLYVERGRGAGRSFLQDRE